jgi:hypothetical protein
LLESPSPSESPSPPSPPQNIGSIDPAAVRSGAEFDALAGAAPSEPPAPGETEPAPPPPSLLEFDAWYKVAAGGFMVASAITKLKSLAFDPANATAREAFSALYDTCREIPALNFLLMPAGKWMARAMAVGAFAVPMAGAVRGELLVRRGGAVPVNDAAVASPGAGERLPEAFLKAVA